MNDILIVHSCWDIIEFADDTAIFYDDNEKQLKATLQEYKNIFHESY